MGMFPKQTTMIETWSVCYDIKEGMMVEQLVWYIESQWMIYEAKEEDIVG